MSEHAPDRFWSGIEISKVIAGTLAAVTAAVVGSFLGVAGTLAGAAVASVVGSLGMELYQRSLHRGAKRLSAIAPTFVKTPAAVGTPPVAAATEEESPSHTVPPRKNLRWGNMALAAVALFVLAVGSLTAFELIVGEPLASAVGASSSKGTSVVSVFRDDDSTQRPAVTPSTEPTQGPTSGETTTDPAGEPAPTTTTTEPSTGETTPATDATTGPTADTPRQTPPGDNQEQNQDVAPQDGTTE